LQSVIIQRKRDDRRGAGFAKVTSGMEFNHQFYKEYGGEPAEQPNFIYREGNAFFEKNYPKLDYIQKAYVLQ